MQPRVAQAANFLYLPKREPSAPPTHCCAAVTSSVPMLSSLRENMQKPIIAITMGDAAGVGPEIIVKSLAHRDVYDQCQPLVIGDAERLRQADRICATG